MTTKEHSAEQAYGILLKDPSQAFSVEIDRHFEWGNEKLNLRFYPHVIDARYTERFFPGSFNPLHDGHKHIYSNHKNAYDFVHYELSLSRIGKPPLSFPEMMERLNQFSYGDKIVVTNVARMVEKIAVLGPHNTFIVGIDTIKRMADDYTLFGIKGLNASFVVQDREIDGKVESWPEIFGDQPLPLNVKRSFFRTPPELLGISSTKIREGWKEKQKAASIAAVENVSELMKQYNSSKCTNCKLTRGELRKRGNHVWNYNGSNDWECDICTKAIARLVEEYPAVVYDPATCPHESVITHSNGHKDCLNCKKRLTWT